MLRRKFRHRAGIVLLFVLDALSLYLILWVSASLVSMVSWGYQLNDGQILQMTDYWWIVVVWLVVLTYGGGYFKRLPFWDEVKFLWKSAFHVLVIVALIIIVGRDVDDTSKIVIMTMFALSLVLFPYVRSRAKMICYALGLLKKRILIVGSGEFARMSLRAINKEKILGYEVAGFVGQNPSEDIRIDGYRIHGYLDKLGRYLGRCVIHDVLIAAPEIDRGFLTRLINSIQTKIDSVMYVTDMGGVSILSAELIHLFEEESLIIQMKNNLANPLNYLVKRLFDYGLALCLLIVLLPLLGGIALLIKMTSRGPALYTAERVGRGGRKFRCYKFRTMYQDADDRLAHLLRNDASVKKEWEQFRKIRNDPRVTPLGRFLRATSLDELLQIFNVLKGDMSLVGPRPVTQEEITVYYKEAAELYYCVPPGLTGLWQVSGRSHLGYDVRITLDSLYVRNWNIWLDIMILVKTARVILKKEGAF